MQLLLQAKRSRNEKYASLSKAKRNFKNNNDIKINNNYRLAQLFI